MTLLQRASGTAAALALGLVAPVAFAAHDHFTHGLDSPATPYPHGARWLGFVVIIASALIAGYAVTRRPLDRVRASAAWTAALAAGAVFVIAASRAGDRERAHIVDAMPIVGALELGGPPVRVGSLSLELREHPAARSCSLRIVPDQGLQGFVYSGPDVERCVIRIRHDERNGIAVAEWSNDRRTWGILSVHSTSHGGAVPLDVRTLRRSLSVPPSWASLGAFSSALALGLLLVATRQRRRASTFAALADAEHEGQGWFALADGRRLRAASAEYLATGTFSVRVAERAIGAYRASAASAVEPVGPGATRDNVEHARGVAASCESIALTSAAIGAMPALAALLVLTS